MRIVFLFPFFCLIFASCPRVEKSLPGCNHIRQTVSAESARPNTEIGRIRIFAMYTPYTPVCIAPTKTQARLGRSLSNKPHTPRRKVAGYPKSSNSRSLSTAL